MTEVRTPYRPPELVNASAVENAFAPISERNTLAQAQQALDSLFNRPVSLADAEVSMPGRYTSIEGIHPAPAPVELPHQYYESPVALGPAHPSKAMGGAIFDQSIGTWRPRTGLDVATTTTGLPPGMEGDFVRTAEQRGQIAAELEARQQKESFAALSGSEQLSVKVYDLVRAAERVPQNIRKVVTTVWEQANGLIPRINTKFNVALSAAASMAALAACGGALPKSPEPTPTPRIVQTVDVVKPTATATTPFETPTPPAVTKEQLANVLIQQDTYTADVVESWKGDMTPTQLLARKVLKGELGPEDDAAEVRSMSYSMKSAGGFSFDIAASASDQTKMRIGFASPDGSLQMRDVRAVQEQNGTVTLLMNQEGRTLVIARRSLDGKAFVINPADAPGVIKRIGENSPELSLGKDMIVIEFLPTPEPKQPDLDLLSFLFLPQKAKAESPPTPSPTTGNVFSGTVEARASATALASAATAEAPATPGATGTSELQATAKPPIEATATATATRIAETVKPTGAYKEANGSIVWTSFENARDTITPPVIPGLKAQLKGETVVYVDATGKEVGQFNPEVTFTENGAVKRLGAVLFDRDSQKLKDAIGNKMPFPFPLDVRVRLKNVTGTKDYKITLYGCDGDISEKNFYAGQTEDMAFVTTSLGFTAFKKTSSTVGALAYAQLGFPTQNESRWNPDSISPNQLKRIQTLCDIPIDASARAFEGIGAADLKGYNAFSRYVDLVGGAVVRNDLIPFATIDGKLIGSR